MKYFILFFGFLLGSLSIGNAQDISIHKNIDKILSPIDQNGIQVQNYKMASSHINTLYAIEKDEKKVISKPDKGKAILKRNLLGRLSINGIKVSAFEFKNVLKTNKTAFSMYQEGENIVKTAFGIHRISIIAVPVGLVLTGFFIGSIFSNDIRFRSDNTGRTFFFIGLSTAFFGGLGIIVGSIVRSVGTGKMKSAINLFNASNDAKVSLNPIIYKKHLGLSLALNF